MSFESLNLHETLVAAVRDAGYTVATDVQQRAIPPALEGRDLMVSSSTSSGKTPIFVLPALTRVLAARLAEFCFFKATAPAEIYPSSRVGSVRCVCETDVG